MNKKYKIVESNKLHYRKYTTKIKFHTALSNDILYYKNSNELGYLLAKLKKIAARNNKSGKHKIQSKKGYWREPTPVVMTHNEVKSTISAIHLIMSDDKNIVSYGYYNKSITVFTNMEKEWIDLLENTEDKSNILWKMSDEAKNLLGQNENICIVNRKPEYEFKVYLRDHKVDSGLAKFLESNKDGFRVGSITMENIKESYTSSGNYFYAKNRKYLTLVQLSYGGSLRRVDRMVYKYTDTIE